MFRRLRRAGRAVRAQVNVRNLVDGVRALLVEQLLELLLEFFPLKYARVGVALSFGHAVRGVLHEAEAADAGAQLQRVLDAAGERAVLAVRAEARLVRERHVVRPVKHARVEVQRRRVLGAWDGEREDHRDGDEEGREEDLGEEAL